MIEQRGKNVWRITVYTGKVDGVYKRVTETFHGLKSEAQLREHEIKAQVKAGGIIANKKITFGQFSEKWLKEYAINLAPKTYNEYIKLLKKINKAIGNIPLRELKPLHLAEFYNSLRQTDKEQPHSKIDKSKPTNKRISENTVLHYYTLIGGILNKAVEWEFLERNPNERVERPKLIKREPQYYDMEQVQELISCLEKEPLKTQAIIFLTLDTGARRGEITGLNWDDIDLSKGIVDINKTTQLINGKVIEKSPKNNSSIRKVSITDKTINVLKLYRREQLAKEIKLGSKWEKTNKVFTSELGGYMYPPYPSQLFDALIKKYNLKKINFHGLRHTSVSILINAGIQVEAISDRVGHSTPSTTQNIYSHTFEKTEKKVVNVMNSILSKTR